MPQEASAGDSLLIHEALAGSDISFDEPVDTLDLLHRPLENFTTTLTQMLYEAGVTILAGSDSDYGSASYILQDELEYLVTAGLTPMDAIIAATSRAAKAIGMEHQIGTIAQGNLADFVVLEKNPLDDIRNIRSIRKVVLNGNIQTSLIGQPEEKN
jgi:imidazolonepropionase-like amidohydrolase